MEEVAIHITLVSSSIPLIKDTMAHAYNVLTFIGLRIPLLYQMESCFHDDYRLNNTHAVNNCLLSINLT